MGPSSAPVKLFRGMWRTVRIMTIEDLKRFLKEYFEGCGVKVYLFGSRARGAHVEGSDIDIAILSQEDISDRIAVLRAILEESNLPYKVDIVDLSRAPYLRDRVMQEGIEWL